MVMSGNRSIMKISRLNKYIDYGMEFARTIKRDTSREDMQIVRCILCGDIHNITSALRFLGTFPDKYNKAIQTGIFIELNR